MAAVIRKYEQLRKMDTVWAMRADTLSKGQKRGALELLTLVKKKRCGRIKVRVCANGSKQRRYINKHKVSSPSTDGAAKTAVGENSRKGNQGGMKLSRDDIVVTVRSAQV